MSGKIVRISDHLARRKHDDREQAIQSLEGSPFYLVVLRPGYETDSSFELFLNSLPIMGRKSIESSEPFLGHHGPVEAQLYDEIEPMFSYILQAETLEFSDMNYFRKNTGTGLYIANELSLRMIVSQYIEGFHAPTFTTPYRGDPHAIFGYDYSLDDTGRDRTFICSAASRTTGAAGALQNSARLF